MQSIYSGLNPSELGIELKEQKAKNKRKHKISLRQFYVQGYFMLIIQLKERRQQMEAYLPIHLNIIIG